VFLFSVVSQLKNTLVRSAKRKMDNSISRSSSPPKVAKLSNSAAFIDLTTISKSTLAVMNSAHVLNNLLAKEKRSSEKFEEYLQKSLLDDSSLGETFNQSFGSPEPYTFVKRHSFTHLHSSLHPASSLVRSQSSTCYESSQKSISDEMSELTSTLKSQKQADRLYELRLQSFLVD
jgi:hypothetical protein